MTSLKQTIWRQARPVFNRAGLDLVRLNAFAFMRHIERLGINTIYDVGANVGQYGDLLRANGYGGKIVSFEPVSSAFAQLSRKRSDSWQMFNLALGDAAGTISINVSEHSTMSSVLDIKPGVSSAYPWASVTGTEAVKVSRFDEVFSSEWDEVPMLKLDVQGFEDKVIAGAEGCLSQIPLIQLEAAVGGMYQGEPTIFDHAANLSSKGYQMIDVQDAFRDEAGRLLHVDALFERIR